MINNKRGLSTVVTTLIIILLVLVAIGIIWVVIRGIVEGGSAGVDFATKCLSVDVRAIYPSTCNGGVADCDITLERKTGGEAIAGVKLVFKNSTTSQSSVSTRIGNIAALATNLTSNIDPTITDIPDKVEVSAYFEDAAGVEYICSQNPAYSF